MNKISAAFVVLAVAFCAFLLSAPASAQQPAPATPGIIAQQQPVPPTVNVTDSESKSFTGKIVKQGDKLVLADATGKTAYQLDDQVKAKEFLNKNVKVTGILDGATTTIHVSSIDPV